MPSKKTTLAKPKYLLDVNVLIALTQSDHTHHQIVTQWFDHLGLDWGMCAFSEAGFLRISTNPKVGNLTFEEASEILVSLVAHSSHRFWPIAASWASVTAPFSGRIFGHRQITDAYLLGLAIQDNGVLVTLDKRIQYLAGPNYSQHVLVLEESP